VTSSGNVTFASGVGKVLAGTGQPFDYGNVTKTLTLGLSTSTSTVGLKSGTVTINNTDLTTAGAGQGSADGNDTVNVQGSVLAKRVVSAPSVGFGRVISGVASSANFTLTTTGDDNSATRVNVAGTSSADANGVSI